MQVLYSPGTETKVRMANFLEEVPQQFYTGSEEEFSPPHYKTLCKLGFGFKSLGVNILIHLLVQLMCDSG